MKFGKKGGFAKSTPKTCLIGSDMLNIITWFLAHYKRLVLSSSHFVYPPVPPPVTGLKWPNDKAVGGGGREISDLENPPGLQINTWTIKSPIFHWCFSNPSLLKCKLGCHLQNLYHLIRDFFFFNSQILEVKRLLEWVLCYQCRNEKKSGVKTSFSVALQVAKCPQHHGIVCPFPTSQGLWVWVGYEQW